jgi:hypothetical protein
LSKSKNKSPYYYVLHPSGPGPEASTEASQKRKSDYEKRV